jgi:OOP family OmpA-OmpF porin
MTTTSIKGVQHMMAIRFAISAAGLSVLLLAGSPSAFATDSGFYLAASYGKPTYDVDVQSPYLAVQAESDSAWSVSGGYRFNPYIGIEAGYANLGDYEIQEYPQSSPATVSAPVQYTYEGPTLSLIGSLPIGNFAVSLKAGVLFASITNNFQLTGVRSPGDAVVADKRYGARSTQELQGGVILGYTFAEHVFINVDWTRFVNVGDGTNPPDATIDTLMLGLSYRF